MKLTIDSSVFVEVVTGGVHRRLCARLLRQVFLNSKIAIIEPAIFLYEFINAVDKAEGNPKENKERLKKAIAICDYFLRRENVKIWPQDIDSWRNWIERRKIISTHKTQDELFLYTASHAESVLVTLDGGMMKSPTGSTGKCGILSPYECLELIEKDLSK